MNRKTNLAVSFLVGLLLPLAALGQTIGPTPGGGSGITQLTGDVTAGPGSGSQAATVGSIGGEAVSLAGSLTTSGAHTLTLTTTGNTNVTFPTSGTLATTSGLSSYLPLAGGTMSGTITGSDAGTWGSGGINAVIIGGTTTAAGHFTTLSASGHVTVEGVTSTGATGTGKFVFDTSPTIASLTVTGALTATGLVTNADLANSTTTLGSTTLTLGSTAASVTGLSSLGLTGNLSASGIYGTTGAFIQSSGTLTDTTSSGTIAAAYGGVLGNHTWAASSATTITNVFGLYVSAPTAGTNVTFTNQYGLGSDSLYSAGNITLGGVVTSTHVGDATWTLGDSGSTVTLSVGALELVTGRMKVTATTLNLSSDWNIEYNSDTMLSRSAAGVLRIGKTNDTATGQLQVASIQTNGVIYSAAGTPLPTCNSGAEGTRASVSDATAPVYHSAYVSGGTVHEPVYCDGTNWIDD